MKTTINYPLIAKEGWLFLSIAIILSTIISVYAPYFSIIFWFITLFVLQFFRDPKRKITLLDNIVVSAADGKVIAIEKTTDPYLKRKAIKVSVFMNVFNVHSNKAPISGLITNKWYFPGKFINASLSKASLENERCAITIRTKSKKEITSVQIAGLIARRILCYSDKGDMISSGERYGFIKFGSRVDLFLPIDSKIKVNLGQKVKNTESIIAELN